MIFSDKSEFINDVKGSLDGIAESVINTNSLTQLTKHEQNSIYSS